MGNSNRGHHLPDAREFRRLFAAILGPESAFYALVLVYSVAISLLTLAIPISVQLLVDSVANTGLFSAVLVIGLMLFVLLVFSGVLLALRTWTMELFSRRLFSRMAGEIAMTGLLARPGYFENGTRAALFNRFFDIMTIKKNVPFILGNGFTLLFQSIIGILVVSLYHFYFFIFSVCLVLLVALIWRVWSWKAISSSFVLSSAKHDTAAWLQNLAINNAFYKTAYGAQFSLKRADELIHEHLRAQKQHFSYSFRQLLCFLLLYALASAVLLIIGGWLVIMGELTLGQLVAAELIMSAIFYGLPQLAGYLDYYYDVCAAAEELSRFETVETESTGNIVSCEPRDATLVMKKARMEVQGVYLQFNLLIPDGKAVKVEAANGMLQEAFSRLLNLNLSQNQGGSLLLGGCDLHDFSIEDLRGLVMVLDRQTLLPISIREYLLLANDRKSLSILNSVLELLELDDVINVLPMKLDTVLTWSGSPLMLDQALRLKLAHALLGDSRILVLGQIFDCLPAVQLDRFIKAYVENGGRSLLYFTRREDLGAISAGLWMDESKQVLTLYPGAAS